MANYIERFANERSGIHTETDGQAEDRKGSAVQSANPAAAWFKKHTPTLFKKSGREKTKDVKAPPQPLGDDLLIRKFFVGLCVSASTDSRIIYMNGALNRKS